MTRPRFNRQETLVYAVLWLIVFLIPLFSIYLHARSDGGHDFLWSDVFHVWRTFGVFFVVFLLHNFLLAPLLVERQRRVLYFSLVAVLVSLFVVVQCIDAPSGGELSRADETMHRGLHRDGDGHGRPHPFDDDGGPGRPTPHDGDCMGHDGDKPHHGPDGKRPGGDRRHYLENRPPIMFGQPHIVSIIVLVLMLGMNLGVKLYFRQKKDRQRMDELERKSLEQQLEHLKYQINPHFLMNTLNNIHALVDIDAERAKSSIVELSKIMRFVLYEGSKRTVPLARELAFTQNYIELMRMRVTDRVKISVDMPGQVAERQIPPMILVTFVENAFKHGVSYRQESFIDISVSVSDSRLTFNCRNSRIPQAEDSHGGVGLENVRQRLKLIYSDDYTLDINENQDGAYSVCLDIPLLPAEA